MADEYARKYMDADQARFVEKLRMPRWLGGVILAGAGAGLVAGIVGGAPFLAPLVAGAALVFTWGMFSTLRVVVTGEQVNIQLGVFGPRVPVEDIVSVEVVDYSVLKYGGWGIRFGLDGSRAFSLPVRGGKAVRIRRRVKRGIETLDVSSENPEALRAAVEAARSRDLAAVRLSQGVADAPASEVVADPDLVVESHEATEEHEK